MRLSILHIAYPFAPVGRDAVGGAEQVLYWIDKALAAGGHRSIVIASEDSDVHGELVPVPLVSGPITGDARRRAHAAHRTAIEHALARWPVALVHLHGLDFHAYLPAADVPSLVTLHLPVSWYPDAALHATRPRTWFNCVSNVQQEDCRDIPNMLPPIENGVPVEEFASPHAKRSFGLVLARVCPEKGIHLAIDAAKRAQLPLLIAGEVYDYPEHRHYFEEEIRPRLDRKRRFIGPVDFARKRRLLAAACCVVIPSLVAETSSLVAREALASGTPVVAFARGALPETIEHGRTGFLVSDIREMAAAMLAAPDLDPHLCRQVARTRFSLHRMVQGYFSAYGWLAEKAAMLESVSAWS